MFAVLDATNRWTEARDRTADSTVGGRESARPPTEDEIPAFVAPVTIEAVRGGLSLAPAGQLTTERTQGKGIPVSAVRI